MSYCRWGEDSDVYLYVTTDDEGGIRWVCAGCKLDEKDDGWPYSPQSVLLHLEAHRQAKHKVPERAFDRLRMEIEQGGP